MKKTTTTTTTTTTTRPPERTGKDGTVFDPVRYVGWALKGFSSIQLRPMNTSSRQGKFKKGRIQWRCPKCGRPFAGMAIKKHREAGCSNG